MFELLVLALSTQHCWGKTSPRTSPKITTDLGGGGAWTLILSHLRPFAVPRKSCLHPSSHLLCLHQDSTLNFIVYERPFPGLITDCIFFSCPLLWRLPFASLNTRFVDVYDDNPLNEVGRKVSLSHPAPFPSFLFSLSHTRMRTVCEFPDDSLHEVQKRNKRLRAIRSH